MSHAETETLPGVVRVERWPTEIPLLILVVLAAVGLWVLLAVSIIGLIYAALLAVFFFVAHVAFIAHLRGSAVRLGPEQMPELHARVVELARRTGLRQAPTAYVMQAGGSLNALATKLFATNFIVLFSDLLQACGDNTEARDMIIAHELGHLKAGHLRWMWLLLPGYFVPFLGGAYSRAREYTCDRFGMAACADRMAALRGLAILAAGGTHGPKVNLQALTRQRRDLDTGWMTFGHWLSTHPSLAHRIEALEPALGDGRGPNRRGATRAVGILLLGLLVPAAAVGWGVSKFLPAFRRTMAEQGAGVRSPERPMNPAELDAAMEQATADFQRLAQVAGEHRSRSGEYPVDTDALYAAWVALRPLDEPPRDPFDGQWYGYDRDGERFLLYSTGPDLDSREDDIVFRSQ